MKNQLLLTILALLTLTTCKQVESNDQSKTALNADTEVKADAPDYVTFNKRLATVRAFYQAHCDENIEAQKILLADSLKWSPAVYNGGVWLSKSDCLTALQGYHNDYDNIKYIEGILLPNNVGSGHFSGSVYPKEVAQSAPNTIRIYGTWTGTHVASGKEIGVKWYSIAAFNEDNKIHMITDYWDTHGLAAQIAAE